MARQRGIIRIKGSLGGITFYQKDGENFSRETNGPSKEKIATDPSFKRTRENNQEFSGATNAGKALRMVQKYLDEMSDSKVTSRIMKLFRTMVNRAPSGTRGQRPIDVIAFKDLLVNFNFNDSILFDSVFLAPYTVATNAGRTNATFTIPDFDTEVSVHAPQGATHFKLIGTVSVISSFNFNPATKKYEPSDPDNNILNGAVTSALIPIGGSVGATTTMVPTNAPAVPMVATSGLVACLGIEFYQMVAGVPYLLSASNCMKIVNVF